jgi:hypothetical protein
VLTTTAAMILAGIASQVDSSTYDARPLYLFAVYVFALGVLVWFSVQVIWPVTAKANAWRLRTLAEAGDTKGSGAAGLEIVHAKYGARGQEVDVTGEVRLRVVNNLLDTLVDNSISGGFDPTQDVVKTLTVKYKVGGREGLQHFLENTQAQLP